MPGRIEDSQVLEYITRVLLPGTLSYGCTGCWMPKFLSKFSREFARARELAETRRRLLPYSRTMPFRILYEGNLCNAICPDLLPRRPGDLDQDGPDAAGPGWLGLRPLTAAAAVAHLGLALWGARNRRLPLPHSV